MEITRLEKRQIALKEDPSGGKIFEICLSLKMSKEGSSDRLSDYDEIRYLSFIRTVVKTWDYSYSKNTLSVEFDESVKHLCKVILSMYEEELKIW